MTSVQRFRKAISGQVPDRVPVVPKIYVDLAAALTGVSLTSIIENPLEALVVEVEAGALCRVDAVRQFHFPFRRAELFGDELFEVGEDNAPIGRIDLAGGLMTVLDDASQFQLANPVHIAFNHFWNSSQPHVRDYTDALRVRIPDKNFYEEYGCGDRQRSIMATHVDDLALIGDCGTTGMAFLVAMRGMENALFDLSDNPKLVHKIIETGGRIAAERGKFNVDQGITTLRINDSVGNMSVISPAHWREYVKPYLSALCSELHSYSPQVKLYCHICGNILPIVEDLATTGLDCIAPLDPLGNFTVADVRKRVGDSVSLMGGVNTLSFVQSTIPQLRSEAANCIAEGGASGGFVLGSGCVVPRSATIESLRALHEAAEECGRYDSGTLAAPFNQHVN